MPRRASLQFVLCTLLALTLPSCYQGDAGEPDTNPPPMIGRSLQPGAIALGDHPDFSYPTLDGGTITPEALHGKVVVLDFWATWCRPCMDEMPETIRLYEKYKDRGVAFVGMSLDQSRSDLGRVVKEKRVPWPQVFDGRGFASPNVQAWGVYFIPVSVILSRDGEVVWIGYARDLPAALEKAVSRQG